MFFKKQTRNILVLLLATMSTATHSMAVEPCIIPEQTPINFIDQGVTLAKLSWLYGKQYYYQRQQRYLQRKIDLCKEYCNYTGSLKEYYDPAVWFALPDEVVTAIQKSVHLCHYNKEDCPFGDPIAAMTETQKELTAVEQKLTHIAEQIKALIDLLINNFRFDSHFIKPLN